MHFKEASYSLITERQSHIYTGPAHVTNYPRYSERSFSAPWKAATLEKFEQGNEKRRKDQIHMSLGEVLKTMPCLTRNTD